MERDGAEAARWRRGPLRLILSTPLSAGDSARFFEPLVSMRCPLKGQLFIARCGVQQLRLARVSCCACLSLETQSLTGWRLGAGALWLQRRALAIGP